MARFDSHDDETNLRDLIDHIVTGALALVAIVLAVIVHLQAGETPPWLVLIAGTATGFYFRGRVNGQWNKSRMGEIELLMEDLRNTRAENRRLLELLTNVQKEVT